MSTDAQFRLRQWFAFSYQPTKYWQAKLILVTVVKPYFRVVTPESLLYEQSNFEPLETDPDFHVTRVALESFEPLVERFLVNGSAAGRSFRMQDYR
jgi:hypothetical protein